VGADGGHRFRHVAFTFRSRRHIMWWSWDLVHGSSGDERDPAWGHLEPGATVQRASGAPVMTVHPVTGLPSRERASERKGGFTAMSDEEDRDLSEALRNQGRNPRPEYGEKGLPNQGQSPRPNPDTTSLSPDEEAGLPPQGKNPRPGGSANKGR
jgi:hypothetical protein